MTTAATILYRPVRLARVVEQASCSCDAGSVPGMLPAFARLLGMRLDDLLTMQGQMDPTPRSA